MLYRLFIISSFVVCFVSFGFASDADEVNLLIGSGKLVKQVYPYILDEDLPKRNDITVDKSPHDLENAKDFLQPDIQADVKGLSGLEEVKFALQFQDGLKGKTEACFGKITFQKMSHGLMRLCTSEGSQHPLYDVHRYLSTLQQLLVPGGTLVYESTRASHLNCLITNMLKALMLLIKASHDAGMDEDRKMIEAEPGSVARAVQMFCIHPDDYARRMADGQIMNMLEDFYRAFMTNAGFKDIQMKFVTETAFARSVRAEKSWYWQITATKM
jgi:hypothetical protein